MKAKLMPRKTEEIRQFILENVEDHPADITLVTAEHFGISRQAAHRHVSRLTNDGLLIAEGATRNRTYKPKPLAELDIKLPLSGLQEDKVWRETIRPLLENLPSNILGICQYGFTEMVNNAIDHSEGTKLKIQLRRTYQKISLFITDNGVGIFNKIQKTFDLDDPLHAILELSKGKLTSDPAHHTGEGIFFTSRMFDAFLIWSDKLSFTHKEGLGSDFLFENPQEKMSGTWIGMEIATNASRTTQQVFDAYTSDDYGFSKTSVPVKLAAYGGENLVSRSQAKRLLVRFEKFKEIILDFSDVEMIGQAFADEIFRVFQAQNPTIRLSSANANEQVQKMIQRVLNNEI
jgi:anti-sigma regulatory factor (Ser/Thr protein kinase)